MYAHLLVMFFVITETAEATTYHVAQDGSGDFTKIQDAAKVASRSTIT